MKLFIVILPNENEIDDILTDFIDIGVAGATIIDGAGLFETVTKDIPIFAGFRHLIAEDKPMRKVILSCIEEPEILKKAQDLILSIFKDYEESEPRAVMFTLPVDEFIKT